MLFITDKTYFFLITYLIIFHVGMVGLVLNRGNIIKIIMSLELLLLAVNLNFILFSSYLDDLIGHVFVIFVLVLSAVESSIGLSILAVFYSKRGVIEFDLIKSASLNLKF